LAYPPTMLIIGDIFSESGRHVFKKVIIMPLSEQVSNILKVIPVSSTHFLGQVNFRHERVEMVHFLPVFCESRINVRDDSTDRAEDIRIHGAEN
jgi:hypothetical protein